MTTGVGFESLHSSVMYVLSLPGWATQLMDTLATQVVVSTARTVLPVLLGLADTSAGAMTNAPTIATGSATRRRHP
jgi:hypothetical protein